MSITKNKTRKSLAQAMLRLLIKHDYESITITSLCSEADVVRKTFYNNFLSKDDVIYFAIDEIFSEIEGQIDFKSMNTKDILSICFNFIDANQEDLLLFYRRGLLNFALNSLVRSLREGHALDKINIEPLSLSDSKYISAYIASTLICVIETWIENAFAEDIEYVVQLTETLLVFPKLDK